MVDNSDSDDNLGKRLQSDSDSEVFYTMFKGQVNTYFSAKEGSENL